MPGQQPPPPQAPSANGPPPPGGASQQPDGTVGEASAAAAAGATTGAKERINTASTKNHAASGSSAGRDTVTAGTDKFGKPRIETVGSVPASIAALRQGSPINKEEPLTTAVEPMKQDFYLYAVDNMEECLEQARAAVREAISTAPPTNTAIEEDDPYLTMTNLNERLMASWQAQSRPVRMQYLSKEEEDRRRFQLDDEVASRHCATLTARSRSPKVARKFEFDPVKTDQPFPSASELNNEKEGAATKKRSAAAASEDDGEAGAKKSRSSGRKAAKTDDVKSV